MASCSNLEKLPLESALYETPQIASLVGVYDHDAKEFGEYVYTLHQLATQLVAAQNKVTSLYQEFAKHLRNYTPSKRIPGLDPHGFLTSSVQKFAEIMSEMSSWQHIFATQIADGVVYPLSIFLDSDMQEIRTFGSLYMTAGNDVDRSIAHYCRFRKRDPMQERHEAVEGVYNARKKFHHLALHYYSKLNQLQLGKQIVLLEPLLGLVMASKAYHQLGTNTFSLQATDDFLSGIGVTLKGIQEDYKHEREDTQDLIESMVAQCQLLYYPQPPAELGALPPDTTLSTKSGYLNVYRKYMGVMTSWERQFVFIEGGNLMYIPKGELVGTLLMEIDASTYVHASDTDDRSHVFTVLTSKKSAILQALNDRERDEWMLTIEHVARHGGYIKSEKTPQSSSILSGVGQFLVSVVSGTSSRSPASPPSPTPQVSQPPQLGSHVIPSETPIVFDLLPWEEEAASSTAHEKSPSTTSSGGGLPAKVFSVRFLGSMKVNVDTGQTVVFQVMRRILAARAIHNMFCTSQLQLFIMPGELCLRDPQTSDLKLKHEMRNISFWAAHNENDRLFGYIVRHCEDNKDDSYACFVYEAEGGGKAVCSAIGEAAKTTYSQLL